MASTSVRRARVLEARNREIRRWTSAAPDLPPVSEEALATLEKRVAELTPKLGPQRADFEAARGLAGELPGVTPGALLVELFRRRLDASTSIV